MGFRVSDSNWFSTYQLRKTQKGLSEAISRISSGKRINRASDDVAGMMAANKLDSRIGRVDQAIRNAGDVYSIAQIADSALGYATELIQGVRVKAIQAGNPAHSSSGLKAIQSEISHSLENLKQLSVKTSFNGEQLLSGKYTGKKFMIGSSPVETIEISLGSVDPSRISDNNLGVLAEIDVTTSKGVQAAIGLSDIALGYVSSQRSGIGSVMDRTASAINNLSNARINMLAAESEIRDLDFAEESVNLNKIKLLAKASAFAHVKTGQVAKQLVNLL